MTRVDLAGVGIWSAHFSDWDQFCALLRGEPVEPDPKPKCELIPARDRRRAPLFVRMAVEVMDQACRMAAADPSSVATVFGSSLGDVEITDYMCSTVASTPRALSPTRFHNSVHNACTGYWSIATASHNAANAVSAYDRSPAMALLEGAVQAIEERAPVVVAFQEPPATTSFEAILPARQPLAIAMLLMPEDVCARPLGHLALTIEHDGAARATTAAAATAVATAATAAAPAAGKGAPAGAGLRLTALPDFSDNFAASMLELLGVAADGGDLHMLLPVSETGALALDFSAPRRARRAQGE